LNPSLPTPLQLDALREVANIGCGQAASALSRLMGGRRVDMGVAKATVSTGDDLLEMLGGDVPIVAVSFGMEGDLRGRLLMVLPDEDAHRLVGLLLNVPIPEESRLKEDERSALSETANILASACLSAIGRLVGLTLMPSVPNLREEHAGAVVDKELEEVARERARDASRTVMVLEADFATATPAPIHGRLAVVTDLSNLSLLLKRLGV